MLRLKEFTDWLHESATRSMEYICGFVLCTFSANILFAPDRIKTLPSYSEFFNSPLAWYVFIFFIGLAQLVTAPLGSNRANTISAFLLMISSVILAVFAIGLYIPSGINTGVTTYGVLALFAMFAGQHLMHKSSNCGA